MGGRQEHGHETPFFFPSLRPPFHPTRSKGFLSVAPVMETKEPEILGVFFRGVIIKREGGCGL